MDVPTQDYPELLKLLLDALIKKNFVHKWVISDDNDRGSILLKIIYTKPNSEPSGEVTRKSWIQRSEKQTKRSDSRFVKHLESKNLPLVTRTKSKTMDNYKHIELPRSSVNENSVSEQVISPIKCIMNSESPDSIDRVVLNTPPVPLTPESKLKQLSPTTTVEQAREPIKSIKSTSHVTSLSEEKSKLKNIRDNLCLQKTSAFLCQFCQTKGYLPYIDCPRVNEQRCFECYIQDDIMIRHLDCCKSHMLWDGQENNTYLNT